MRNARETVEKGPINKLFIPHTSIVHKKPITNNFHSSKFNITFELTVITVQFPSNTSAKQIKIKTE